jgi:hypothetical protein
MALCDRTCQPQCYACGLRDKNVGVAPSATPTRHNRIPTQAKANPVWERTVVGEQRPGGTFMPVLSKECDGPMRIKEFTQNRRIIESELRAVRQGSA